LERNKFSAESISGQGAEVGFGIGRKGLGGSVAYLGKRDQRIS